MKAKVVAALDHVVALCDDYSIVDLDKEEIELLRTLARRIEEGEERWRSTGIGPLALQHLYPVLIIDWSPIGENK